MNEQFLNQKVLITTQSWFFAPDGIQYRAVWGTLKGIHAAKDALGFQVNHSHANFYIHIGNTVIAGCQALYCIRCDNRPDFPSVRHVMYNNECGMTEIKRPNEIYLSE